MRWTSALLALSLSTCTPGVTSSEGNCTASKHCAEYVGLNAATGAVAKAMCEDEKGTFKDSTKCDLSGSIGGCRRKTVTDFYFPGGMLQSTTVQTPEDVVDACFDGAYVDSAHKEWSSDAGLPRGCTATAGAMSTITLRNVAPARLQIYQCIGMNFERVGEVDAGTSFTVAPAVSGETIKVALGLYTLGSVTVSSSNTSVDVP